MNTAQLIVGRFQPFHIGHISAIMEMENPVVAVVRGTTSQKNKSRNPFDFATQCRLIEKSVPGTHIIEVPDGYLPDIFQKIETEFGLRIDEVWSGPDRQVGYQAQLERAGIEGMKFHSMPRLASATEVRKALADGNREMYETMMVGALYEEFDRLKKIVEDSAPAAAADSSNLTGGVAKFDKPIPDKVFKRKKLETKPKPILERIEEFLEKLNIPNRKKAFVRSRSTMPQIKDIDWFLQDLADAGIRHETKKVNPENLSPTQKEFNEDKVKGMVASGKWAKKPIMITQDNFIVDGHHRWLAAAEAGSNVDAIILKTDIKKALEFLKSKPYVDRKPV